jgi:hypothetical protein
LSTWVKRQVDFLASIKGRVASNAQSGGPGCAPSPFQATIKGVKSFLCLIADRVSARQQRDPALSDEGQMTSGDDKSSVVTSGDEELTTKMMSCRDEEASNDEERA